MAEAVSSFPAGCFELSRRRGATLGMQDGTSRPPCGAGWGAMGFTWSKNLFNGGVLAAGADWWCEATPEKKELTSVYGGVRHWERGRSASRTTGCAYVLCNEEGHMSRDCPTTDSGGRRRCGRGCFKCGEEGHMSRD
ncbi:uncharacterized protein LOC125942673 [Dermacentor silvarum]|uniref:uncharacterized protein LOC125942673 n=1 Tax=Dermacentor silvarum TaxID=543639 RepID=UPI002100B50C|nr:uncharacterized protein LOC125942673 [Dermacentor silvarum]